jgi:hypothetical protein
MSDSTPREGLPGLVADATEQVSALVRNEIALARRELTASAKQAAGAGALLGGAAVAGHLALLLASVGAWGALARRIGPAPAGVVAAGVCGAVSGVLGLQGYRRLRNLEVAPRTVESLRQIPSANRSTDER